MTSSKTSAWTPGASVLSQIVGKRVVTIGGGTGPFALLSHLKRFPCTITAVVSMADSGGSSRRLMDEFGQLPFGDLRQALVALSRKGTLWREAFTYRFGPAHHAREQGEPAQTGVSGHSLGNLIISALSELHQGDLLRAIAGAQALLDTAGDVLPVTLAHVTLCARLVDGKVLRGETTIDTRGKASPEMLPPIERVFLEPEAPACPEALHAIEQADVVVLGPGDLYTSVLPNLLVPGVAEAIRSSRAKKVYICNLMTKHGETDGFRASDFVREVLAYLGGPLDRAILHAGALPAPLLELYAAKQQHPVTPDVDDVRGLVGDVIVDDFLGARPDHLLRHDASRLIRAIFERHDAAPALATAAVVRGHRTS
jgi:uncharacterized cofD-like protein